MAEKYIQSLKNPLVQHWEKLRDKNRERKKSKTFLVEGLQEWQYALAAGYTPVEVMLPGDSVLPVAYPINRVSPVVFNHLTYRGLGAEILAEVQQKDHTTPPALSEKPMVMVLDRIEKPGNLGALYRTALATGVDAVVLTNPLTDLYHPNTIRSSVGCSLRVPTWIATPGQTAEHLKKHNIELLATALGADGHLYQQDLSSGVAWILGNEHSGLGPDWLQLASKKISIPMLQEMDSLNVSVSGAVVFYETLRQRIKI
jgi:TrmH family RNA methyltransferase